jgi:hypothetical protein
MYTLMRSIPLRQLLFQQAPALFGSLIVAELSYKFHSFTLECIAFLFTWYIFDALISKTSKYFKRSR